MPTAMVQEHRLDTVAFAETNLAAHAVRILRDMFLSGELEPGQRIIESEMAGRLHLSRGPVREALRMLEKEGVVRIVPRRGTFVAELSPEDIYEVYSLRAVIEGLAARILAERAGPDVVAELEECVVGMEASKDNLIEFAKLDLQFHERLCRLTGHTWLYKQWLTMKTYVWLFIRASQTLDAPGNQQMVDLHKDIVDAIRARLPESAELVARHHTEVRGEALRLHWKKEGWSNRALFSERRRGMTT